MTSLHQDGLLSPVRIFVQARMSSSRFPGKMLAPFLGRPMIACVTDRLIKAGFKDRVIVLTGSGESDDPLADYVERRLELPCFRGDTDNVLRRFQAALRIYEAEWIIRVSGDSPMIDGELVAAVAERRGAGFDLLTNVLRRTFPQGQSIECIRARSLAELDADALSADDTEHVTTHLYRNAGRYRICSIICQDAGADRGRHVVDTIEDLRSLERLALSAPALFSGFAQRAVVETGA